MTTTRSALFQQRPDWGTTAELMDPAGSGTAVPETALQPGDLVFFSTDQYAGHVGIYLGQSRFVHAPDVGQNVQIDTLNSDYWRQTWLGARRLQT